MEYEGGEKERTLEMKYDCLVFDVDDTLYPLSCGLSAEVVKNIREYMLEKLGIESSKVASLCLSLYKSYGTTMAGLKAIGYKFDYDDFHGFVHGRLPYQLLKPDPVLRSLLLSIPIRKVIFTNADTAHANRVLRRLGVEDCFEKIVSFDTLNETKEGNSDNGDAVPFDLNEYISSPDAGGIALPKTPVVCKPFEEAYEQAFMIAGINPKKAMFFDDSIRNLQTGKRLGLHTVWVGSSHRTEGVDYALESIHNMKEAVPELWESFDKLESVKYAEQVAIETSVKA